MHLPYLTEPINNLIVILKQYDLHDRCIIIGEVG